MTFYVSCRPLRYRKEIISPKQALKYSFAGLKFTWDCMGHRMAEDGRWLYEITLDKNYSTKEAEELQTVFLEGLAAFGAHLKTPASAKELADKVTGLTFTIDGEIIKPPPVSKGP